MSRIAQFKPETNRYGYILSDWFGLLGRGYVCSINGVVKPSRATHWFMRVASDHAVIRFGIVNNLVMLILAEVYITARVFDLDANDIVIGIHVENDVGTDLI